MSFAYKGGVISFSRDRPVSAPTDRVLSSLISRRTQDLELPRGLRGAIDLERQMTTREGYFVAYQSLPPTSTSAALLLYVFNAEIARMVFGFKAPLLPRLLMKPFEGPWGSIKTMVPHFKNDHELEWRSVGISCSASLYSLTEATPFRKFEEGYKGSGAPKPDGVSLMKELLLQHSNLPEDKAHDLAKRIHDHGIHLFEDVGGSMMQIFIQQRFAEDCIYLAENGPHGDCCKVMTCYGPMVTETLREGNLDNMQIRLIARPDIFLDETKSRIYLYCSKEKEFNEALSKFRLFISSLLHRVPPDGPPRPAPVHWQTKQSGRGTPVRV